MFKWKHLKTAVSSQYISAIRLSERWGEEGYESRDSREIAKLSLVAVKLSLYTAELQ